MRFYKQSALEQPHRFYCGVDLHARCMYLCILDAAGQTVLHQDYPADAPAFLDAVAPYRDGRTGRRRGTAEFLGRDQEPWTTPR